VIYSYITDKSPSWKVISERLSFERSKAIAQGS
jgi:hypothetical protein